MEQKVEHKSNRYAAEKTQGRVYVGVPDDRPMASRYKLKKSAG